MLNLVSTIGLNWAQILNHSSFWGYWRNKPRGVVIPLVQRRIPPKNSVLWSLTSSPPQKINVHKLNAKFSAPPKVNKKNHLHQNGFTTPLKPFYNDYNFLDFPLWVFLFLLEISQQLRNVPQLIGWEYSKRCMCHESEFMVDLLTLQVSIPNWPPAQMKLGFKINFAPRREPRNRLRHSSCETKFKSTFFKIVE